MSQPGGPYPVFAAYIADIAGLKTINLYGSSNSIFSFAAWPNMPPVAACIRGCSCGSESSGCLTCYTAPGGTNFFRSDASALCSYDLGDMCTYQFDSAQNTMSPLTPCNNGFFHPCNPGMANTVGIAYRTHIYNLTFRPCDFYGVYTPPSANQDMTLYNFCYVLTPHHDLCMEGPYCWSQGCECFGPLFLAVFWCFFVFFLHLARLFV